jgi:hypothetical protein
MSFVREDFRLPEHDVNHEKTKPLFLRVIITVSWMPKQKTLGHNKTSYRVPFEMSRIETVETAQPCLEV